MKDKTKNNSIIKEYKEENSIQNIAKKKNKSYSKIRKLLVLNNISRRPCGRNVKYLKLSLKQKQIILGTLLGDGCFIKRRRRIYALCITHGGKQEEYLKWKTDQLKETIGGNIYKRDRYDKRTDKIYISLDYHSRSHPFLNELYTELWKDGRKGINVKVLNMLTPLGIAIWYCDDGNLYQNKDTNHLSIATNSLKEEELKIVIRFFKEKYNLDFHQNRKIIRLVSLKEIHKFINIFSKYIPKCMKYKKILKCFKKIKI